MIFIKSLCPFMGDHYKVPLLFLTAVTGDEEKIIKNHDSVIEIKKREKRISKLVPYAVMLHAILTALKKVIYESLMDEDWRGAQNEALMKL
jgi:hypothetical protein